MSERVKNKLLQSLTHAIKTMAGIPPYSCEIHSWNDHR